MDWINECSDSFKEYNDFISNRGIKYLVKNKNEKGTCIKFNCTDESYLMESRVLSRVKYKMFMSATIGDHEEYANEINVCGKYSSHKIPNMFDYTKSPIFYIGDRFKMSYNEKDTSFPHISLMINKIIEMYEGKRGIIQTGNYSFSKLLYDSLTDMNKKRAIVYENSEEKIGALDRYKYMDNLVLIGPTLMEGLSLDNDLCRFQIIMKVPYSSLSDNFVKEKMNMCDGWYMRRAATSIVQGVGRGVRNENDWCVTFILDGCFTNLVNSCYSTFPSDFIERIKYLNPDILIKNNI